MPLRYRQLGYALAASANWACQFVTVFAGPIAYANGGKHGWTTWIWFLVFCAVSVVYGKLRHHVNCRLPSLHENPIRDEPLTEIFSILLLPGDARPVP